MQLYVVNFIPLLGSLYMFRVFLHPSSGVQFITVSTATGTNHSIVSAIYVHPAWRGTRPHLE